MFSLFKRRIFFVILGLVLAALLIWVFGPEFHFGRFDPLGSVTYRVMAIAALFSGYGAWTLIKRARTDRASNQLAAAVVKQSQTGDRPSADVVQLRERFEEAIAALKQKKQSGHSLYELPWYVIIGAPGSGKTTALVNSGLHFPLEQRSGKGALRGVGGTRNCDWWFTEEAVFLDTAGRYTTQDSDAGADSAGWAEFLALLKKYRKRRPVNGVILAISAHDLMVQGQAGREAHVAAARRRLNELNKELRIQLPVYVLVTKCDLVAGFAEYFDDVAQEGRTQVWGVTFPYELTQQGTAAGAFPAEFDALAQRLNERVFARLEDERDVRRRAKVFGFPQQMAALRESLAEFVADVFESTRFDQRVLLRGVYFTSGTQEGTPIDRLLGALGRRFSVPAEAVAPPAGRGKAYFIERFLKDVLLAESGLAGVNRRVEMQKAAAQLGAYAAMALAAVIGVLVLWYSYGTNRTYLSEFAAYTANLELPPAGGSVVGVLPRLDKVAGMVTRARSFRADTAWVRRGWGLDQGPWVEQAADDVYRNELSLALLNTMKTRIEERLRALLIDGQPDERYEYLRAYLMLADSKNFDSAQVKDVASREWARGFVTDPTAAGRLSDHFARLLEYGLPGIDPDKDLVTKVRESIGPDAVPSLIYSQVKLEFKKKNADAPPVEGLFAGQVFKSKDGRRVALPTIFTKSGFDLVKPLIDDVDARFDREQWVWGSVRPGGMPASATRRQLVWDQYEAEYIRTWDTALQSIGLVSLANLDAAVNFLRAVAGSDASNSALRQLLVTVDNQTFLVSSMDKAKAGGFLSSVQGTLDDAYRSAMSWLEGHKTEPGAQVTAHFSPIHALLTKTGDKAPIDALLDQIRAIEAKLKTLGSSVGADSSATGVAGLDRAAGDLKRDAAGLPGSAAGIGALVAEIGSSAVSVSSGELNRGQRTKYQDVVQRCRQLIEGAYPFDPNSQRDVTLQDFGTMFKPGGVFESYLRTELADSATIAGSTIQWKQLPSGASAALGPTEQRQLQDAIRIRDLFFSGGGSDPRVEFSLTFQRMDDKSRRFELELDGASVNPLRFANESPRPFDVTWPGTKSGTATATFEEFSGGRPYTSAAGPWAWFRLIGKGKLTPEANDRFLLNLQVVGSVTHFIDIQITAKSVNNPFKDFRLLQNFSCGR